MESIERKLKLKEGKRAQIFERMQSTYNLLPQVNDASVRKIFLNQARMIDQLRSEFMEIMDEINLLNMDLNPDYIVNYKLLSSFDDLYSYVKTTLNKIDAPSSSVQPSKSIELTHVWNNDSNNTIKIPRMDLPSFDGDIQNFPFFYETFKRVIHENPKLTDSERVHYLFSHLTGKATSVCAGVVPAAENYTIVWEALIAKYHDIRALATSYLNNLFSMKPINGPSAINLEKVLDKFAATISALKQLKIDNLSDFIFIHLGLKLLDSDTAKNFEMSIRDSRDMPNYDSFVKFVREQVKILYRTTQRPPAKTDASPTVGYNNTRAPQARTPQTYVSTQSYKGKCTLCHKDDHSQLYNCKRFLNLTPNERFNFIKENSSCTNCLSMQHTVSKCSSQGTCRKCRGKHHSLLHFNNSPPQQKPTAESCQQLVATPSRNHDSSPSETSDTKVSSLCTLSATSQNKSISTEILATAKVIAAGRNGKDTLIRCLLDPGSQKHYVTSKCCRNLGLIASRGALSSVKGIGGVTQPVKGNVNITFTSMYNSGRQYKIEALVLEEITSTLPTCPVDISLIKGFDNLPLADDTWASPGEVDLLIGVSLFAEMLLPGKVINSPGLPDALETVLGYIVLGNVPVVTSQRPSLSFCSTYDIDNLIRKFWEVEDLSNEPILTLDDKQAEKIYKSTVTRHVDGRYEVALPFKLDPNNLGNSYKAAESRFLSLERKFKLQPGLKSAYDDVIKEHLDKKYLSQVNINISENAYYIPHHAIRREDKTTTKVRVVLDASAKTDSGLSLNDILYVGPSLQVDLLNILLNLRLFPVAISSDVRQMYLCIGVREQDRRFQRIIYRFDPQEPLKAFQYNRVAFGVNCSPFLALRTVQQLADDEGSRFPAAKEIVSRDTYMDDIASSVMNVEQAIETAQQLIDMFKVGGFQLTKWSSNSAQVLHNIPEELRLSQSVTFDREATLKILGLRWYPAEDVFAFEVTPDDRTCTKRHILSSIARLFDVLGLVAPIIVFAKLLIKELWILKIDWDEVPPNRISRQWQQFQTELPLISNIKFPRHIGVAEGCSLTILGFADASEKAYGGAVYAYVTTSDGHSSINLISAKSKVAPLKIISLARLELCAALLLSQLMRRILNCYSPRYAINSVLAFSDSTVALSWMHSSPHRWQTFVANRVAKIHENLSSDNFYYVKGTENPSDCLSRGLTPAQLVNHPLWTSGPSWVKLPRAAWPVKPFAPNEEEIPEAKDVALVTTSISTENIIYELSRRFSSWNKYVRTVAYLFKFIKKLPRGTITATDLTFTEFEIFRSLQTVYFSLDINYMKSNKPCTPALQKLCPFLDNGVIRVGGRLVNCDESYDYKHPILLPRRDHMIDILIDHYHRKNLHTGPETLMSILRRQYWIISARRIIRQRIHKCNLCFRTKPRSTNPMMGNLPSLRVKQVEKAFTHTGCDYAGPLSFTPIRRRGIKSQRAYLCIFTCMTTRAVHIELAADLSTASFLSAFKRFLSRRGPVKCMYSDNGTNFIGAKTYLQELYNFLAKDYQQYWEQELAENRISWKCIPPSAPHFGGCWESTVKCVKTHLFRSIGQQILSYEELLTVLIQIESLLNSRPLSTLSSDPSEPLALTPAHFLNVTPIKFIPAAQVNELQSDHLLQRYELLDKIVQSFWKRWRNEYLHTLQTRQKWNTPSRPVAEGTVVVIMQDNVMPLHWPLGIVTKTFPGKDGTIRVALVKSKNRTYQRPVVKLCPLPSQ